MCKELEFLLSPISILKGFGEKTIAVYKRLLFSKKVVMEEKTIPTIMDLIYHKPEKVIYRKQNINLSQIIDGDLVTVKVKVDEVIPPERGGQPYKIRCFNETGFITIVYFNMFSDFINKTFRENDEIVISGKVEKFNEELQMNHPDYISHSYLNIPSYEQIYPLTAGLINRYLRQNIQNVLKNIPDLPEWIDKNLLFEHQWKSWKDSIICMHNAKSDNELANNSLYVERLAFDELLADQIALRIIRNKNKTNIKIEKNLANKTDDLKQKFLKKLPFELTIDQKNVIQEIENDIYSNHKMTRLLQGDVGSGKTVVAFLTMLPFIQNKKQIVLMVPTSILANQHFEWLKSICKDENINIEILTGKIKGKKREKILERLKNGEIDILVGTHALFQENVEFKNLSYVVIDEQHRFGVVQRLDLIKKGKNADTLIMTATPIPRTLSLAIYGDMDISTIKQKPKNRKEIITTTLQKERLEDLIIRIKERIKFGEKIYWVCPLIEESENLQATPLFQRYEEFKMFFDESEIGFIHGKITEIEKDKIMEDFSKKDSSVKILISTTVIEVGIDVPDATVIVIESPERYGLSQIHQLRGRVGRSDKQSYCILFYEKLTVNLNKRMSILKASSDGFFIAEEDLKLRGSGELLGLKQSGYQDYLIASLPDHYQLLLEASKIAKYIVDDKKLYNQKEIQILLNMFGYNEVMENKILT